MSFLLAFVGLELQDSVYHSVVSWVCFEVFVSAGSSWTSLMSAGMCNRSHQVGNTSIAYLFVPPLQLRGLLAWNPADMWIVPYFFFQETWWSVIFGLRWYWRLKDVQLVYSLASLLRVVALKFAFAGLIYIWKLATKTVPPQQIHATISLKFVLWYSYEFKRIRYTISYLFLLN
jgi:hypothetical protein